MAVLECADNFPSSRSASQVAARFFLQRPTSLDASYFEDIAREVQQWDCAKASERQNAFESKLRLPFSGLHSDLFEHSSLERIYFSVGVRFCVY